MSQGLLPYEVEVTRRADALTARAGLPLVLETRRALRLEEAIRGEVPGRERETGYTEAEKIEALVRLLAAGGDCLDDIRTLQADSGLARLLGRPLPSADTLRHFLYAFHNEALLTAAQEKRLPGKEAYIPAESPALQGLGRVNTARVQRVAAQGQGPKATLDHDATIRESHKREALPHDQGGRGYQPAALDWVEQDLGVADEYRDGNVPAGMDNLRLIQRGFASRPPPVTESAFRADSACYDERVLKWLANPQRADGPQGPIGFTISADMTDPLRALCAAVPEATWQRCEARADETVWCTEVECTPGDWPKDAWPLRYLALRLRKKQGELYGKGGDTKVPGRHHQPRGRRGGSDPLALGEGRDDRVGARHHQERARRREPALRPLRGQRGLVSAEPPDLQRAQRADVARPARPPERGAPQAPALRALLARRPAPRPRGAARAPHQRRGRGPRRPDRRAPTTGGPPAPPRLGLAPAPRARCPLALIGCARTGRPPRAPRPLCAASASHHREPTPGYGKGPGRRTRQGPDPPACPR